MITSRITRTHYQGIHSPQFRFSLGRYNTAEDINKLLNLLPQAVQNSAAFHRNFSKKRQIKSKNQNHWLILILAFYLIERANITFHLFAHSTDRQNSGER